MKNNLRILNTSTSRTYGLYKNVKCTAYASRMSCGDKEIPALGASECGRNVVGPSVKRAFENSGAFWDIRDVRCPEPYTKRRRGSEVSVSGEEG